ncbi:hypothetical protein FO519_000825 [Halicephalobus sp. NKZ332]|nr:hypothetical protein FO519_000825 [Halicephalobus sp. NKZ332]
MRIYLSRFVVGVPYLFQRKPPKWCNVEVRQIAGVDCRVYIPDSSTKKSDGLLVFIHGGGWMLMQPNYYDGPLYAIIAQTGLTVVSIDYRLAPEVTFPTPVIECEKVVKKIYEEEYRTLNIDRTKISIMGDSAGGNLSAVICQRLLRTGLSHYIRSQILVYPATNFTDFQSPSYQYYENAYKGTGLLNPKIFARMVLVYLGIEANPKNIQLVNQNKHVPKEIRESKEFKAITGHDLLPSSFTTKDLYSRPETPHPDPKLSQLFAPSLLNPDLNPIFGKNLEGLSEAMIITVGVDILRDEGVLYGKRLESFNVPVKWFHYERAFHGILNMPKSQQRRRIIEDIVSFLRDKI